MNGDVEDYFAALEGYEPGNQVTLTVVRDRQRHSLEVMLGEDV